MRFLINPGILIALLFCGGSIVAQDNPAKTRPSTKINRKEAIRLATAAAQKERPGDFSHPYVAKANQVGKVWHVRLESWAPDHGTDAFYFDVILDSDSGKVTKTDTGGGA